MRATPRPFLLLLASVGVYRLTLLGRGAMAFTDETIYFKPVIALQALAAGDVVGALQQIATDFARPGAALAQMPVAALQAIPFAFGIPPSNPLSLLIPTAFNVAVSLITLYWFFELCVKLSGDTTAALTASLLYALLVNTNLYLRHLMPYDLALCVAVYAMWLIVTRPRTVRLAFVTGLLAGAVITIYPGYYLLAIVLGIATAGPALSEGAHFAAKLGARFSAAILLVIGAAELLCRTGGVSYIGSARAFSRTITQGTFEEGWTFLPEYLVRVEGPSGIMLLAVTVVWLWRAASALRRKTLRPIDWLLLPALLAWAWQAASSAQLQSMVLYGRTIHPWMLFMALAAADAIAALPRIAVRNTACAAAAALSIVAFVPSARTYYRLAYPPDVLYSLGIDTTRVSSDRMLCELTVGTWYMSPAPLDRDTGHPYSTDGDYLLVNFCHGSPSFPRLGALEVDERARLYDGPHFLTFPAYGYEGLAAAAREQLARTDYRVRAYRVSR